MHAAPCNRSTAFRREPYEYGVRSNYSVLVWGVSSSNWPLTLDHWHLAAPWRRRDDEWSWSLGSGQDGYKTPASSSLPSMSLIVCLPRYLHVHWLVGMAVVASGIDCAAKKLAHVPEDAMPRSVEYMQVRSTWSNYSVPKYS
jgi:hypothetical protein